MLLCPCAPHCWSRKYHSISAKRVFAIPFGPPNSVPSGKLGYSNGPTLRCRTDDWEHSLSHQDKQFPSAVHCSRESFISVCFFGERVYLLWLASAGCHEIVESLQVDANTSHGQLRQFLGPPPPVSSVEQLCTLPMIEKALWPLPPKEKFSVSFVTRAQLPFSSRPLHWGTHPWCHAAASLYRWQLAATSRSWPPHLLAALQHSKASRLYNTVIYSLLLGDPKYTSVEPWGLPRPKTIVKTILQTFSPLLPFLWTQTESTASYRKDQEEKWQSALLRCFLEALDLHVSLSYCNPVAAITIALGSLQVCWPVVNQDTFPRTQFIKIEVWKTFILMGDSGTR